MVPDGSVERGRTMSTVDLKELVKRDAAFIEVAKREYQDRAVTSVEKLAFALDRIVVTLGQLNQRLDKLEAAAADGPVTKGYLYVELQKLREDIDTSFEDVVTEKVESALADHDFGSEIESVIANMGFVDETDLENVLDNVDWDDKVANALADFRSRAAMQEAFDEWIKAHFLFNSFKITVNE